MATATETSLISKLEASNSKGIYCLYSDYLRPFTDLSNPKKPKKSTKPHEDQSSIRSLAKKFLSFLNRTLSILPKRLPEVSKSGGDEDLALELFEIYKLCLDCLDMVSSQLACKPYSVDVQRVRMVHCLEAWGRYKDAEVEGLRVLERLRAISFSSKSVKNVGKFVPDVDKGGGDKEFAFLVVEIVATLVKCTALGQSQEGGDYDRVLILLEEVRPWFRVLDANAYEKLQRVLVTYLGKCTLVLVEQAHLDKSMLSTFCYASLTEYSKSSMNDQVFKFSRRICSSLFALQEKRSFIGDILSHVLDCAAHECKVEVETTGTEFVELVAYCANKCRTTNASFCGIIATSLNEVICHFHQFMTPLDLILRLYAMGLNLNCNVVSRAGDIASSRGAKFESLIGTLLDDAVILHDLPSLLGSLSSYFQMGCKENCVSSSIGYKDSVDQTHLQFASDNGTSMACTENRITYLSCYLNALKFLCQPLAESVNLERKQLVLAALDMSKLSIVQDVFHQLCNVILSFQRGSSGFERGEDEADENSRTVLSVAVASFTLSLGTKLNLQKSESIIEHIISSEKIQIDGLKYLIACLHNIGVVLYRNKQAKEAWNALNLCCRASWICVRRLCGRFVKGFDSDLSENIIREFVCEACKRSALLLEVLHQFEGHQVENTTTEILENWSFSGLVKQWIKMDSKCFKHMDRDDCSPTSYGLLSSSVKVSEKTIGIILEQELIAYEKVSSLFPEFCQQMQMNIISLLLQYVYVTPDTCLEKSRILVRKGRALRFYGVEGLDDCIQCLSEAIFTIEELYGDTCTSAIPPCHQLAVAYCLRALCTQEAEPNSKQIFKDINTALHLWLTISVPDSLEEDKFPLVSDNTMILLYNIIDLLSMKGCMDCHHDIYRLIIRIFKGSESLLIGLQQNFSFLFASSLRSSNKYVMSDITVDEVNEAASKLISNVPLSSCSVFLAGYLYYDLCPRLVSNGRLNEQDEKCNETGTFFLNQKYGLKNLQVNRSVARTVLFFDSISWDFEACYLSAWKIMQCYLESTLQVGIIHEIIGNGAEAETFFQWGKSISFSQSLPMFIITFSSILGKLYCKRRQWDLAEKELKIAKQILLETSTCCCSKCRLILEVNIDQYLGDLCRHRIDSTRGDISIEILSDAKRLYKSALEKLNLSEWKNSLSCPEDSGAEGAIVGAILVRNAKCNVGNNSACSTASQRDVMKSTREGPKIKTGGKQSRKTKNATKHIPKEQSLVPDSNLRLTRSRYRSLQNQCISSSSESEVGISKDLGGNEVSDGSDMLSHSLLKQTSCKVSLRCETCMCNKMRCWQSLPGEVMESRLLQDYIHLKWEFVRRQLLMKLLNGLGKCFASLGEIHEAHEILFRSILVLTSRNSFSHSSSSVSLTCLLGLVGKDIAGDVFTVERAAILYDLCWFSLKSYSNDTGISCCDLSCLEFYDLVHLLRLAFVLSREIPILFQKVSRLLAALYILSASSSRFSLSSNSKELSENYWASYFHQASIGTHLSYQLFAHLTERCKVHTVAEAEGSYVAGSACIKEGTCDPLRLAPESIGDLEEFVTKFFSCLPCTTIVCISLLGSEYASLLQDLLLYPIRVHAWLLVSRLNSKSQPIAMLLPVSTNLQDDYDDDDYNDRSSGSSLPECKDSSEHWHCPWGSTVVDDVAPAFKMILEENYLSSSVFPLEDTKKNRMLWWTRRKKLDCHLGKLLRNLEDSWFGSWKCLLLGDWLNCEYLDLVHRKLVDDLKSQCKLDVDQGLLKVILGGSKYAFNGETHISHLWSKKGCYIARVGFCDEASCGMFPIMSNAFGKPSDLASQLLNEAVNSLEGEDSINREPIILALDYEVQMLPWENLPVLRNQEVYRMPSVSSISAALDISSNFQEQVGRTVTAFPLIDPLDAFYLLNPSGDLSSTQVEFENWFRDQKLEGKAGSEPTVEELAAALNSHDLFIYFGHGSGAQYISRHEIQKLEKCAATLLMGCSSGSLTLNGSYIPQGISLSYLLGGSPAIVANLWEVTDKDIDRFGKAMLDAWLRERSNLPLGCAQCNSIAEEFKDMDIRGCRGNAKRKNPSKKLTDASKNSSRMEACERRPKIGSFMSQAREACTLPFLIGAAPVCYGVPTYIAKKKNL
ncbi:separase [Quillaja saponaria]|uniref:separase n=1 Tax=Quillaja saponaria TaxID=32244 RepID=A0AAD7M1R9_QUISA|nr:separase [Quillaja saponaria]